MSLLSVNVGNLHSMFNFVQLTSGCHQKYAVILKKGLEKDEENLFKKFHKQLVQAFKTSYKEKNPYIDRIISFLTIFAVSCKLPSSDDSLRLHPLFYKLFHSILKISTSTNDSHRYWACTLLNKIFQDLLEIPEDLYENVVESLLERLQDPKSAIRCQAILGLYRLQDPSDKADHITSQFCKLIVSDLVAKVRQMCVEKLALNPYVLPVLIDRARDVDQSVRLAAFAKLQKVPKYLKIADRRLVLLCAFKDSTKDVRDFVGGTLLPSWLEHYSGDYCKLMKSLRFDANEEDINGTVQLVEWSLGALFSSATISSILKCLPINEEKWISYEKLNWDTVLYYRIVIDFLRKSELEKELEGILTEAILFCGYIKGYIEFVEDLDTDVLEFNFVLQQLFVIAQSFDVIDTPSRHSLNSVAILALQNHHLSVLTAVEVVRCLVKTIPDVNERSVFLSQIISNILYGESEIDEVELERMEEERRDQISHIKSEIITLTQEEHDFAHVEENFLEAERVRVQLDEQKSLLLKLQTVDQNPSKSERKTDAETLTRCLTIAEALLLCPTVNVMNPTLMTLERELISWSSFHEAEEVKTRSLRCYSLCCLIDRGMAKRGVHLFCGLLLAPVKLEYEVLLCCLKIMVDLLVAFGLELMEEEQGVNVDEEEGDDDEEERKIFFGGISLRDFVHALPKFLNDKDQNVQFTAARGMCRLLHSNVLPSAFLMSKLIIKWAQPAAESPMITRLIGIELSEISKMKVSHGYFKDAVLITLQTLAEAPSNSNLNKIDMDNIIKYMCTLCMVTTEGAQLHTDLAIDICNILIESKKQKSLFLYSKALTFLKPSIQKYDMIAQLCDNLQDVIIDKKVLKNVVKFISVITKEKPSSERPD